MMTFEALTLGEMIYQPLEKTGLRVEMTPEEDSVFSSAVLSFVNAGSAPWEGILRIAFGNSSVPEPYFLLPGFMVGTNRGDAPLNVDSKCPRLRRSPTDFPASPWWLVRADRLSHPVAMVYDGNRVSGLFGAPRFQYRGEMQYAGFGCDIDRGCVYYTLGWENAPRFFVDSHHHYPREIHPGQCITLDPGETLSLTLRYFDRPARDCRSVHEVVRDVYNLVHCSPRKGASAEEAVLELASAIDEYAWLEKDQAYSGFVFDRGGQWEYRPLPSCAWTNGISVAMPMLLASLRLENAGMRQHALTLIQDIVDHSTNPASGLPWTVRSGDEWSNRGWWYDKLPVPGHTGYLVGQMLYSVLCAYEAERDLAGVTHSDWLDYVRPLLRRAERECNGDGEFPYVFSQQTGAGLCYDSMSGVWCLAASAYERQITGNREGLELLLRSEEHYYRHYVAPCCCYGGPLDIDKSVDSEGVLAYLRAVKQLHRLTGEEILLDHMRDALFYEFTFKYAYNSVVTVPPLSRGWCSCGGSITSVTNPHIHPMSSSVVSEMLYYLDHRPDEYIASRLDDTLRWGLQTFSRYDGEYDYGKKGWMSERFCYSQGLLTETYPDGSPASTWFALMPWASSCILEGLCGDYWSSALRSY